MQELFEVTWIIFTIILPWIGLSSFLFVLGFIWFGSNFPHPITTWFFKDAKRKYLLLLLYSIATIFYILYRFYGD